MTIEYLKSVQGLTAPGVGFAGRVAPASRHEREYVLRILIVSGVRLPANN